MRAPSGGACTVLACRGVACGETSLGSGVWLSGGPSGSRQGRFASPAAMALRATLDAFRPGVPRSSWRLPDQEGGVVQVWRARLAGVVAVVRSGLCSLPSSSPALA
jgi:hypothetical protein